MNLHANARASYVSHLIGAHVISFIQVNDLVEWYLQRTHTPNLQTKTHTHTWTVFAIKSIPLISPSILTGIVGDEMAFHQPSNSANGYGFMWQAHNFTHKFGKKHERSTHVFGRNSKYKNYEFQWVYYLDFFAAISPDFYKVIADSEKNKKIKHK